jgi:hypothetical protein
MSNKNQSGADTGIGSKPNSRIGNVGPSTNSNNDAYLPNSRGGSKINFSSHKRNMT